MTRDGAKEQSLKKMICKQSQVPFLRLIDKIYDDFENRKCVNCKYYTKCEDNFNYCDKNSLLNGYITDEFGCNKWSER